MTGSSTVAVLLNDPAKTNIFINIEVKSFHLLNFVCDN